MSFEWIVFLTWVVTVWVALEAYRDRSELHAEAIMFVGEQIAAAISESANNAATVDKENSNA